MPPPTPPKQGKPFVVRSTAKRDATIGVIAGVALLGFVAWGILHMAPTGGPALVTGRIVAKHFQLQEEEQLTVGGGHLDQRTLDGIHTVEVRTAEGKTFTVFVEKAVYDTHQIGDELAFLPPASESK